ncbi:hypothetical protein D3C71_1824350 [compost metagenome]
MWPRYWPDPSQLIFVSMLTSLLDGSQSAAVVAQPASTAAAAAIVKILWIRIMPP